MNEQNVSSTDDLLRHAAKGDLAAWNALLDRHRERLRRMIALRLDRRLAARLDPSDVVQETLAEAARRLPDYLMTRPVAFYPWLRALAHDRLVEEHRRHVGAAQRSVERESAPVPIADGSAEGLADILAGHETSPTKRVRREELRDQVRATLALLKVSDREVLILRHLEELSVAETAAVLQISEGAVRVRHLRALERFRLLIAAEDSEDSP